MNNIILFQILFIWLLGILIYKKLSRRDNRVPIDDPGFIWLLALIVYGTLPATYWLLIGGEYTPLNARLFLLQPSPDIIYNLLNIVLSYVLGFSFIYLLLYNKVPYRNVKLLKISQPIIIASLIIIILSMIMTYLVVDIFNIQRASNRLEAYSIARQLPLGVRQLIKAVTILKPFSILVIIVALFQAHNKKLWLLWFYILFLLIDLTGGGRSESFLGFFSIIICWNSFIKPISSIKLIIGGVVGLILFLFIGIFRELGNDGFIFYGFGEFDALWANAVELYQARTSNYISMPFSTRFNDFWALIPSQFLWFPKQSPSIWFIQNYHYDFWKAGGGFAFGAIAEASYGYGVIEGLLRGSILGLFFIKFMQWFRRSGKWWIFPMQLYLTISIYQCIRDTSFRFIIDLGQNVFPAILFMILIQKFLSISKMRNNISLEYIK